MSVPILKQKEPARWDEESIRRAADQAHEEAVRAEAMGDVGVTLEELCTMMQAAVVRGEKKRLNRL